MNLKTCTDGKFGTLDWSMYFHESPGKIISPWHDIPYKNTDGDFIGVIEVPFKQREKIEMVKEIHNNPLKQDVIKGEPRILYRPIPFNYGFIPQTWEDPGKCDIITNHIGDDDPIDIVELSPVLREFLMKHPDQIKGIELNDLPDLSTGSVISVEPFSVLEVLDEGETDWKVLCLDKTNNDYSHLIRLDLVQQFIDYASDIVKTWYFDSEKHIKIENVYDRNTAIKLIEHTYQLHHEKFNL